MGRNILYIGNRTTLKEQVEKAIQNRFPEIQVTNIPDKEVKVFQYPTSPTILTLLNYQSVLGFLYVAKDFNSNWYNSPYYTNFFQCFNNYFYVIFDEAHFFLEDSLFNALTFQIYDGLLSKYKQSVQIFMSATIDEFKDAYIKTCHKYITNHVQPETHAALYTFHLKYYKNTYANSSYCVNFSQNDGELIKLITESENGEKWLIFVSSKNVGNDLKNGLASLNIKTAFLTSDKKESRTWKRIVEKSAFDERVLITTSVLDNGVNIIDEDVRNIVLPFCDQTEFLQMLGRKRITNDQKVNVYVKKPTVAEINSKLHNWNVMLYSHRNVMWSNIAANQRLLSKFWQCSNSNINKLFNIEIRGTLVAFHANYFLGIKLQTLLALYTKLKESSENPDIYNEIISEWLGSNLSQIEQLTSLPETDIEKDDFIDFCEVNLNLPIPAKAQEDFYRKFQGLFKPYCYKKFQNDPNRLHKALTIRT